MIHLDLTRHCIWMLALLFFFQGVGGLHAERLPGTEMNQFFENSPSTIDDWWKEGFVAGYTRPGLKPVRPLMIMESLANAFVDGFKSGQKANKTLSDEFGQKFGSIGPDTGQGQPYEELEREYHKQLEAIFHKHMPHIEVDELARVPVVMAGPGVK